VLALLWLPCGRTTAGVAQIPDHALMCILEPDPKAGGCPRNELSLHCLTGVHTTNRVIACSLIYNQNLACDEGTRLDYCDVIFVVGELGMTIITLDKLYFMLSCQLAPTNVTLVQHERRGEVTVDLTGSHLHQEWARKPFGPGTLVGF
jgi:hypothetical protein